MADFRNGAPASRPPPRAGGGGGGGGGRSRSKKTPQEHVSEFWDSFNTKRPGKVTSIFPRSLHANIQTIPSTAGAAALRHDSPASSYSFSTALASSESSEHNKQQQQQQQQQQQGQEKKQEEAPGTATADDKKAKEALLLHRGVPRNAAQSYDAACLECKNKVRRIVRECERTNEKFTDADFDIETEESNCLNGLLTGAAPSSAPGNDDDSSGDDTPGPSPPSTREVQRALQVVAQSRVVGGSGNVVVDMDQLGKYMGTGVNRNSPGETYNPGSVHRVDWIFEAPQFTVKGFHSSDIKQGANEDCSWLAGLATIAHRDDLMQRVCVDRNPECGVYGFVFQRDGEWISVVVDDNLFLSTADFNSGGRDVYDPSGKLARQHRKHHQTGSDALYFARCEDANETWLPILEKAYAKAHGDYEAITELWPGEAVEDLTGGVARTIRANRVLYKDRLWRDMLNQDGNFVFALAAMNPDSAAYAGEQKSGLTLDHAYSILQAREETDEHGKMLRFVKIRNPWGERDSRGIGEWNGPWSDGSREWTPYWLKKLDHQPGDDGVFWMRYEDMLDKFMWIHRTRLFDEKWTVVQKWMSANVAWVTGYLRDKFVIEVRQRGLVVIVLAQLDGAYFKGFEGQYRFELHFVLQAVDAEDGDYLCSVQPVHKWENRTVSCELELEPGRYEVVPKIMATRNKRAKPVEEVVRRFAERNPQKFKQIGMQYDLAHAKAGVPNEDEILQRKRAEARRRRREMWRMHNKQLRKRTALMEMADAMDATSGALRDAANGKESDAQRGGEKGPDDKSDDQVPQEPQKANGSDIKEKPSIQPTPGGQPNLSSTESPEPAPDSVSKEGDPQASEAADDAEPTEPSTKESETKADESIKSSENPTKDASQQTESAPQEEAAKGQDKDEQQEDEEENLPEPPFESEDDDGQDEGDSDSPWNAVCVLGLRVYAQDPEVTIDLVTSDQRKPKSTVAAVEVERAQVPSPTGEKKGEEKI